jgi:hypothetical protein
VNPAENQVEENLSSIPGVTQVENPETNPEGIQAENQEELPTEIQSEEALEEEREEEQNNNEIADESETDTPVVTTRSGRQIVRPSRYAAVTKVSRNDWKQENTEKAIKKELSQLFEELEAIVPVK